MSDVTAKVSVPLPHLIDASFISASGNRTQELINSNDPSKALSGRSRWYEFTFPEPVYLTRISIACEGYDSWNRFELEVSHVDGTLHQESIKVDEGQVELRLGKLASGFRFQPERKVITSPKILKVEVTGFNLAEFHEFEWSVKEYQKKSAQIDRREEAYKLLQEEIEEKTSNRSALDSDIGKSRAELEKLTAEISSQEERRAELASGIEDLVSETNSAQAERRNVRNSISEEKANLSELVRQVRLFPSEIAGFVKEGNRNIFWYALISTPFVLILYIVLDRLFSSAVDLTLIWRKDPSVDIWTVFLTRIPFVVIAVALIQVCGSVVGRLVFEIVKINRQRLDFSKLSIVAKDVSTASSSGLDLSDEEIFERETRLKMALLREHMSDQREETFSPKGGAFASAIVGVARRRLPTEGASDQQS